MLNEYLSIKEPNMRLRFAIEHYKHGKKDLLEVAREEFKELFVWFSVSGHLQYSVYLMERGADIQDTFYGYKKKHIGSGMVCDVKFESPYMAWEIESDEKRTMTMNEFIDVVKDCGFLFPDNHIHFSS